MNVLNGGEQKPPAMVIAELHCHHRRLRFAPRTIHRFAAEIDSAGCTCIQFRFFRETAETRCLVPDLLRSPCHLSSVFVRKAKQEYSACEPASLGQVGRWLFGSAVNTHHGDEWAVAAILVTRPSVLNGASAPLLSRDGPATCKRQLNVE